MRKIKFRAWDKNHKIMKDMEFPNKGWNEKYVKGCLIVMQFTGLKDKNKKEIYEGDIIKDEIEDWECEVIFDKFGFKLRRLKTEKVFDFSKWSLEKEEYEIIGNIYENPELLGGSK